MNEIPHCINIGAQFFCIGEAFEETVDEGKSFIHWKMLKLTTMNAVLRRVVRNTAKSTDIKDTQRTSAFQVCKTSECLYMHKSCP